MEIKKIFTEYPSRITIPLITSVFFLLNFIVILIFELNFQTEKAEEARIAEINNLMNQLVEVVEFNFSNNTPHNIDSFISILATNPDIENIFVINSEKIILHSNRRVFVSENFEHLLQITHTQSHYSQIMISILNSDKITIHSIGDILYAFSPVYYLKYNSGSQQFTRGFIFLKYNLKEIYREERTFALDKLMVLLGESIIILLLLFYTFNKLISSRLDNLMLNIEALETGNLSLPEMIEGNDEIAKVYKTFHKMTSKIEHLIYYDTTTDVFNRFASEIYLQNQLKKSNWYRGLLLIDVDDFKEINDAFGHKFGDSVLLHVAGRIKSLLSESEIVGRVGGDEFLVFTKQFGDKEELKDYIANFFQNLKKQIDLFGNVIELHFTVGVSIFPNNGKDFNSLYMNAELALFYGKEGRDRINFVDEEIISKIGKKLQVQSFAKTSSFFDYLEIYYQPVLDLKTSRIVGLEALLRCNSKELGNISPFVLIPILEETGRIREVGKWVTAKVIQQILYWEEKGTPTVPVNINVSLQEFSQREYPAYIKGMLATNSISPDKIKLEITESEIMKNLDMILKNLKELRSIGIQFAIDDFGTGYSSLSYLKSLPVNVLKIDKSFIADVPENKNDSILVKTIIDLARSFGFVTVAEGVENKDEFDFLRESGCDLIQGYYLSKPIPSQEIEEILKKYVNSPYSFN